MKACNCTLPYFNGPDVCLTCPNYEPYTQDTTTLYQQWGPKIKKVKRITRTIDKYDNEGILIGREVITEEVEDIEREEWGPAWPQEPWIISSTKGTTTFEDNSHCLTFSALSNN